MCRATDKSILGMGGVGGESRFYVFVLAISGCPPPVWLNVSAPYNFDNFNILKIYTYALHN